jgi:hypothetical protein
MYIHPHMAYELARSRQEELRHQASLRPNRVSSRRQRRSSRRLHSWPVEAKSPRSVPVR